MTLSPRAQLVVDAFAMWLRTKWWSIIIDLRLWPYERVQAACDRLTEDADLLRRRARALGVKFEGDP
jgi:hypothetical protein